MNPVSTDVFAIAEKSLAWVDQRQSVLVQNIANVNTPGYVARDVKPFSEVLASEARRTASAGSSSQLPTTRAATGRSLDGNAVVLDDQLEKVAETDTAHQLSMNLYKKYLGMFKTAIGHS